MAAAAAAVAVPKQDLVVRHSVPIPKTPLRGCFFVHKIPGCTVSHLTHNMRAILTTLTYHHIMKNIKNILNLPCCLYGG